MSLRFALRSDTGRERENNEDTAQALPEIGLFIVADGMGGHLGGEVASRLAVETVVAAATRERPPRLVRDEPGLLGSALAAANAAVSEKSRTLRLHGMGTTLTALRMRGRTATIAHVGDSRAFLVQRGALRKLTRDHTLVALLVESGSLRPEVAHRHPERHVLTQAIGPQASIDPELLQLRVPAGARILLSTDGLHDVVPADEIAQLASDPDLDHAATQLVERANALGGPDNITLILVEP